jgi:hypothetical protein
LWIVGARLTALDAIVGRVISKADNVSIVRMIPIVHPAMSSITNLTAVPSVAVSKLINLRTSMSFVTGSYFCATRKFERPGRIHTPFLVFELQY